MSPAHTDEVALAGERPRRPAGQRTGTRPVAELVVYQRAPGTVVRCRSCDSVLMVFATIRGRTCVDLLGLASLG